ncbi:MAG: hypothetical protein OEZ04_10275, partial [Nitrospinota bacterium]|nr:hypothetical protein [Nitrospinota bacterium]
MTEIERTLEQIAEQQAKIQNIQATLNRNRRNIPPGMDTKKAERRRAEVMAAIQIGEMPEHALQEVESELLASRAQAEVENRAREEALSVIEALEGREKSAKQELEASKKRHRALILETLA